VSDGAKAGQKFNAGERVYHEHQTFVSVKSLAWIVQPVAIAVINATYARDIFPFLH
jgi:hypothetical protein